MGRAATTLAAGMRATPRVWRIAVVLVQYATVVGACIDSADCPTYHQCTCPSSSRRALNQREIQVERTRSDTLIREIKSENEYLRSMVKAKTEKLRKLAAEARGMSSYIHTTAEKKHAVKAAVKANATAASVRRAKSSQSSHRALGRRLFGAPGAASQCYCEFVFPPPPPSPPPAPPPVTTSCQDVKINSGSTAPASGVFELKPTNMRDSSDVTIKAYCDFSQSPPTQSIFTVSGSVSMQGSKVCSTFYANDDSDQTYMWVDFTGRQGGTNQMQTTNQNWFVIPRDTWPSTRSSSDFKYVWGTTSYSDPLHVPSSLGSYDKFVPLPRSGHAAGVVVWFGSSIRFKAYGSDYSLSYPSDMPSSCMPDYSSTYNVNVFITDGINVVGVGRRSSYSLSCIAWLTFDWSASTYGDSMVTVSSSATSGFSSPTTWHDTEEDAMGGDLLWTVNGRTAWYESKTIKFGGSHSDPFAVSSNSGTLSSAFVDGQHGLDVFLTVDTSGSLWLGDWGHDNGGIFGCQVDTELGSQQTNIHLAA